MDLSSFVTDLFFGGNGKYVDNLLILIVSPWFCN